MAIHQVGVIGCGLMGSGIAQVCAVAGCTTFIREVRTELFDQGFRGIQRSLNKLVERGKLDPEATQEICARIRGVTELEDLRDCDLIIEAITEDLEAKKALFKELDRWCRPECLFASNTSSLSITEMAMVTHRPSQFVGLHFFNPVPIMALVEVIRTLMTEERAYEDALEFVRRLGKTPIRCTDQPGFIVNRLLIPYLLDAIRALEEGCGTVEDIDQGMKLGCGHPMGPFALLDFIGLDTTYYIANILFDAYKEKRFAPPPLLKQMVAAGRYGRKSRQGFHRYEN